MILFFWYIQRCVKTESTLSLIAIMDEKLCKFGE